MIKNLFIIVPAFNEERSIEQSIKKLFDAIESEGIEACSVILIDDGSTDKTVEKAKKFKDVTIFSHKVNRGLGAAVRTGIEIAKANNADSLVKIDADLQHNPKDIKKLLLPIEKDTADIVYGRRILNFKTTFIRRVGNFCFSTLMRYITSWDIKDSQPGLFAVGKDCLNSIKIFGDYNYTQQVLLSSQLSGMRFKHIDISFSKRFTGGSFVSLSYIYKALLQILVLLICFHPLKFFGRFGLGFLLLGFIISFFQATSWILGNSERVVENPNLVLGLLIIGGQASLAGLLGQLIVNLREDSHINSNLHRTQVKRINKK